MTPGRQGRRESTAGQYDVRRRGSSDRLCRAGQSVKLDARRNATVPLHHVSRGFPPHSAPARDVTRLALCAARRPVASLVAPAGSFEAASPMTTLVVAEDFPRTHAHRTRSCCERSLLAPPTPARLAAASFVSRACRRPRGRLACADWPRSRRRAQRDDESRTDATSRPTVRLVTLLWASTSRVLTM